MIPSPMEKDYWRTRTIAEAQDQGYSHLRVTCSGCGRIAQSVVQLSERARLLSVTCYLAEWIGGS
jgi:uncharacterized cysteine cluster protein YcgN (CxxCxxCC family)